MTKTIKKPYLLQRLKKPYPQSAGEFAKLVNAFSFGGGLVNGGLSKQAHELISSIWRYDYMGSAEFEFGEVPKSLSRIAQLRSNNELIKFDFQVTAKSVNYGVQTTTIIITAPVYVICDGYFKDTIMDYINSLADTTKVGFHTKESVNLDKNICGSEYYLDLAGWHDIENDYIFFTNKEMFDKFCKLLEL